MDHKKQSKVIFLTKYPEKGASSRYRVYQYLPFFKNINFKTQALQSDTSFKLMYSKGNFFKKVMYTLKDYLFRTFFIFKNLDADVIYMQREIFAFGPLWAEILFKTLDKKIILDLDDALFINKNNQNNPLRWDKASRVKRIISRVDLVIAGNKWIRDECIKFGAKSAIHIDVAETIQFENIQKKLNNPLKAIWLGSPTTSKYLFLIEKSLKRIQDEIGLEINIVGGNPNEKFAFKSCCFEWSRENENKYLSISDIGLMPLPNENWSKGKCGGKARTYMASGVIPVVSNIGYNKDLIKHKITGFLCSSSFDWEEALKLLNENYTLHKQIVELNYKLVKTNFDKQKISKILENSILNLC